MSRKQYTEKVPCFCGKGTITYRHRDDENWIGGDCDLGAIINCPKCAKLYEYVVIRASGGYEKSYWQKKRKKKSARTKA